MADEDTETPTANVSVLAEARDACWRASTELAAIAPGVAVVAHVADALQDAGTALDEFLAELVAERSGEFAVDRWPADAHDEPDPVELAEPLVTEADPEFERLLAEEEATEAAEAEAAEQEPVPDHDALYAEAQRLEIKGRTKMSDEELAAAIAEAE